MVMKGTVCVIGPMAATVPDLTIAYRIMAQQDPKCPTQGKFAASIPREPSQKKYVGIHKEWVNKSTPVVLEAFNRIVDYFSTKAGYEVVDIKLPYIREAQLAHASICLCEAVESAISRAPEGKSWLNLMCPANRIVLAAAQHTSTTDYFRYQQVRQAIMQHLAALFEKYPGLLILTPTTPAAGWKKHPGDAAHGFSDGNGTIGGMMYAWLSNLSGCPSLSAPMGYADPEQGEGRVPMGVLATGQWGAEEDLLAWAGDAETYINDAYPGGRLRPEEWVDVVTLAKEKGPKGGANGAGAEVNGN
jgi:Asp-tRNA(Asn)/Glu-tRNA(Gln) amidotransferase A subunit family amidase